MGRYWFRDDIALSDCAVDIEGTDLSDVFETAAIALAAIMVDPSTVEPTVTRTIELSAPALDLLLYDWLSELIYLKDRDREIFIEARVRVNGSGPFLLTAEVKGGVLDAARTALGADAKAVTFHQFALEPADSGWRARIVVDI
jgi:SHS2 domain-containing protein